jgi:putative transposase
VLNRTLGCVRVAWNRTLAWRQQRYRADKTGTTYAQASAYLTAMKTTEELAWLNEVSCVPLQQALRHQQAAYAAFFWRDGRLYLAKMSAPLAFTWSWPGIDPAPVDPSTVTVSRDPCGRWYVSLAADIPEPDQLPTTGRVTGVDLGVKDFAVTSDEQRIPNPRHLERRAKNLARYQRRLARCQQGSANRAKAKAKVARAHRKVRAARKNMVKNRKVAKAISDCGWGTFRDMLEYKAARHGRRVIVIDRWFPSSKMCSACGHVLAELGLKIRMWQCP